SGVEEDKVKAVRWFRRAADQGSTQAMSYLGSAHLLGDGVPHSTRRALRWYRLAAEQGDAFSQRRLGNPYEFGEGVRMDEDGALRWYRMSAERDDPGALAAVDQLTAPPTPPERRPITVEIGIQLEGDGFPSAEELELRDQLEDRLMDL